MSDSANRLCLIEIDEADKVRGNYELMISGAVKHIPNHRYLVSEKQLQDLEKSGIKFERIDC